MGSAEAHVDGEQVSKGRQTGVETGAVNALVPPYQGCEVPVHLRTEV